MYLYVGQMDVILDVPALQVSRNIGIRDVIAMMESSLWVEVVY